MLPTEFNVEKISEQNREAIHVNFYNLTSPYNIENLVNESIKLISPFD